jgi:hypothetical protein
MNDALEMQACNCKQRKPNKEKQFQSRIVEEHKTLDPFNKVGLLFLFKNLLLSLSLFFVLCIFFEFIVLDWVLISSSWFNHQDSKLPSFPTIFSTTPKSFKEARELIYYPKKKCIWSCYDHHYFSFSSP